MQGVPPRNAIRIFPAVMIINNWYITTLGSRRAVVSDAALDPEYFEGVQYRYYVPEYNNSIIVLSIDNISIDVLSMSVDG